jgi:hypothetical protein
MPKIGFAVKFDRLTFSMLSSDAVLQSSVKLAIVKCATVVQPSCRPRKIVSKSCQIVSTPTSPCAQACFHFDGGNPYLSDYGVTRDTDRKDRCLRNDPPAWSNSTSICSRCCNPTTGGWVGGQ